MWCGLMISFFPYINDRRDPIQCHGSPGHSIHFLRYHVWWSLFNDVYDDNDDEDDCHWLVGRLVGLRSSFGSS